MSEKVDWDMGAYYRDILRLFGVSLKIMYGCMYVSVYLSIHSKKLTHTIMKAKQSHIKEGNFL